MLDNSPPTSSAGSSPLAALRSQSTSRDDLARAYDAVRSQTDRLCEPLEVEDYVVQSMPDASPTKWHLAHTSWFFETLALEPHLADYRVFDDAYAFLFNSYYNSLGELFTRADRGLVSRPTVAQVRAYRAHVDQHVRRLLAECDDATLAEVSPILTVGLHHEQQHQELLVTDLKHLFSRNPLAPAYRPESHPASSGEGLTASSSSVKAPDLRFHAFPEGLRWIGHEGDGFAYDNESPRHRVFVEAFEIASRLVTSGEYLDFMADGGYDRPELWLSEGWAFVQDAGIRAPLYWIAPGTGDESAESESAGGDASGRGWRQFTLAGIRPVDPAEPVCHVSFFEADAYARWVAQRLPGVRLPKEPEWELAASLGDVRDALRDGNFVDDGLYHPRPLTDAAVQGLDRPAQMLGDVWEWTASPYTAYPGYRQPEGALGEYNAKFMSNQQILRGGSCATPRSHIRSTYRNFFPGTTRWQFSGIRLARETALRGDAA